MNDTIETIPVIFRAERSGDFKGQVTAVFPTLPASYSGGMFTVYDGCHGSGSWEWYRRTRPALPAEYAGMLRTLRDIYGSRIYPDEPIFALKVYRRHTAGHREAFRQEERRVAECAK